MKSISKSKFITFFVILAVILLLIFFNWRGWLALPKNAVFWTARPFLKIFQTIDGGLSGVWNFFIEIKNLSRDNFNLRTENLSLTQQLSRSKEAARENEVLRRQLGLALPGERKFLLASVVGYNQTQGQYFLIDKGARDGLRVGLAAVSGGDFLIGRVIEVDDYSSKVILIFDGGFSANAITQDTRINGVIRGSRGFGIELNMIPIEAQINTGETVISSGLNDGLPKGLIVGRIADIIKKESEIWQRAVVVSPVSIGNLEEVFVIMQ